jgi:hypothetical protein
MTIRLTRNLDQCALDANGNFKDASEIDWSYDKDSEMPMAPSTGSKPTGMLAIHIFNLFLQE